MATNVAVSEVYIVPADLEPEQIDTATGGLQEPILMFDGSEPKKEAEEAKPPVTSVEQAKHVSEVEIYEYRLLKEQMGFFKQKYPNQTRIDKLNLPLIGGPEVLTCDNEEYKTTRSDADRTGIVLSVPFFGSKGALKGSISAIIRNNVIRDMLPSTNYALVNNNYGYTVMSKEAGQQQLSEKWVKQNQADPQLLFSVVIPVETKDPRSKWSLWVGYPDAKFMNSGDAKAVENFRYAGYGFVLLMMLIAAGVYNVMLRSFYRIQKMNAEFERFESCVSQGIETVSSSATQLNATSEHMSELSGHTSTKANSVASESQSVTHSVQDIASAVKQMSASAKNISEQIMQSVDIVKDTVLKVNDAEATSQLLMDASNKIAGVIDLIQNITFQIDLLAINAAVEAAHAGDNGKGFAVVASEVKSLASQTNKATQEISKQIHHIQAVSSQVVEIFKTIRSSINEVDQYSAFVSSAAGEQTATTNNIASKMTEMADGTKHITSDIKDVMEASNETNGSATEVMDAAKTLSGEAEKLNSEVQRFIHQMRQLY